MPQVSAIAVLTTTSTSSQARLIGEALVAERLAVRVSFQNGNRTLSLYEGAVTEDADVALQILTTSDRLPALLDRLHALDLAAGERMVAVDALAWGAALGD
jgi:uncharacterized protein involved in tolerance to divalent cations